MKRLFALVAALLLLAPSAATGQGTASPFTSATRYDAAGRVAGTISPDPDGPSGPLPFRAARNTYDPAGRLILAETGTLASWQPESIAPADWSGFTVFQSLATTYDVGSRKTSERLRGPDGTVHTLTHYSYDTLGRLECTAVRMNPAAFATPPSSACALGAEGSFGPDRITRNVYDAAGQRLQQRVAVGTGVEGAETTWTYDLNGQIVSVIDGGGNRAELRYDGHGRRDRWVFPSAAGPTAFNDSTPATAIATAGALNEADYEAYGHDANGNVTSRRLRDGRSLGNAYDALNRLTLVDVPTGDYWDYDRSFAYDLQGRRLSATMGGWGGSWISSWTYDALGRVTGETGHFGSYGLSYDAAGRLSRLTHPDGFHVDHDHLITGELLRVRENGATSGIGVLAAYGYDALGRRASLTRGNGAVTSYSYDGIGRLAGLAHDFAGTSHDLSLSFAYNPASQIASRTASNDLFAFARANANVADTLNGLNQVTATGSTSLNHDARGNIISIGSLAYAYTSENRLALRAGGHYLPYWPSGALAQIYRPDHSQTFFEHVGGQIVTERNEYWAITARHVHVPGTLDEPLVWYAGSGTSDRRFLHADERGSIVAISNGAGAVTSVNAYDDYGNPAPAHAGRFGYTGQPWLPELGLHYYRARMYHPALGRFMQTDPIGYEGGINLYEYAEGDPVNASDPEGTLHESHWLLRALVPGQVDWDNAVTAAENGNWGAAAGHAGLMVATQVLTVATLGQGSALTHSARTAITRASSARIAARNPPNRHGSRGAPDHQADVQGAGQRQAEAHARPGEQVLTERRVQGQPGLNRRPDNQIVGRDGRTRHVVESERHPNGAYHRTREADYRRCGITCETRPPSQWDK